MSDLTEAAAAEEEEEEDVGGVVMAVSAQMQMNEEQYSREREGLARALLGFTQHDQLRGDSLQLASDCALLLVLLPVSKLAGVVAISCKTAFAAVVTRTRFVAPVA